MSDDAGKGELIPTISTLPYLSRNTNFFSVSPAIRCLSFFGVKVPRALIDSPHHGWQFAVHGHHTPKNHCDAKA